MPCLKSIIAGENEIDKFKDLVNLPKLRLLHLKKNNI